MSGKRVWTFLLALVFSAILAPGPFAQAGSVTGNVSVVFDDGMLRMASVSAVAGSDGAASGQIAIEDPTPLPDQDVDGTGDPALAGSPNGVRLLAAVNCLAVEGHMAIVGGQVTRSDVARYVGKQVLLFVEDSARSLGRFTWGFYEPQENAFCGTYPWAAYTPGNPAGGSLRVEP